MICPHKIFVKVDKLHRQVDIPLETRNVFMSEHNVKIYSLCLCFTVNLKHKI